MYWFLSLVQIFYPDPVEKIFIKSGNFFQQKSGKLFRESSQKKFHEGPATFIP